MSIVNRNPISSFSGTGWPKNSMALESVDHFGATDHFSGRKKKKNNLNDQNFNVYWKIRIEDRGSRNQGSRID